MDKQETFSIQHSGRFGGFDATGAWRDAQGGRWCAYDRKGNVVPEAELPVALAGILAAIRNATIPPTEESLGVFDVADAMETLSSDCLGVADLSGGAQYRVGSWDKVRKAAQFLTDVASWAKAPALSSALAKHGGPARPAPVAPHPPPPPPTPDQRRAAAVRAVAFAMTRGGSPSHADAARAETLCAAIKSYLEASA